MLQDTVSVFKYIKNMFIEKKKACSNKNKEGNLYGEDIIKIYNRTSYDFIYIDFM